MRIETHRTPPAGRFLAQTVAFAARSLRTLRRNRAVVDEKLPDEATVETVQPSYTDAFNYYVRAGDTQ